MRKSTTREIPRHGAWARQDPVAKLFVLCTLACWTQLRGMYTLGTRRGARDSPALRTHPCEEGFGTGTRDRPLSISARGHTSP